MKNVFVTGGAGFVGSYMVHRLIATPGVSNVLVYDKQDATNYKTPNIGTCVGDIHDLAKLSFWMRGFDTVIHLAANSDISKAASDPGLDFEHGTKLTHNVLEAMRMNNVKRLVYFSGSGVYGDDAARKWHEDDGPLCPVSPYGASKLASEAEICAYAAMCGISASIFRPANLVGPHQTHGVGYDFIRQLHKHPESLTVLGDGSQYKSYLWLPDAIDAVLYVVNRQESGIEIFNLASSDRMSVRDVAEMAAQVMQCTPTIHYGFETRGWKGDVSRIALNCDKIKALGWEPKWNSWQAMNAALETMKKEVSFP